ncbi:MAG TPA: hypothetical protein VKE30_00545 [Chthoniobacterales bacterium]|nr:hypothetical protein [Chthoniobacterales bacterium]
MKRFLPDYFSNLHCERETMNKFLFTIAVCFIVTSRVNGGNDVTPAQVNGTWRLKSNEFKIWALGQQRLQIEFLGIYEYKSPQGPTANEGQGNGIARIEGDTAIFKPDGAEDECKITLKFSGGKLIVTQTGTCGFGNHVYADGTYTKVSSKKPKFDS